MRSKRIIICVLVVLMTCLLSTSVNAQTPVVQPSGLLIFQAVEQGQPLPKLFSFNEDATITPFYSDPNVAFTPVGFRPLKWSPQGDVLAVVRLNQHPGVTDYQKYVYQICLVNRKGEQQVCFDDRASPINGARFSNQDQFLTPDWSATGDRFFYVSQDKDDAHILRLIEADTKTGHTLRTLYTDTSGKGPILNWTRNLQYVAVGVGYWDNPPYLPAKLVNLLTNAQLDLNTLIPSNAITRIICPGFSRSGSYMTAIANTGTDTDEQDELIVFDKTGAILHTLGPNTPYGHLAATCPTWGKSEVTLYFAGFGSNDHTQTVFKYSLQNGQLSALYRQPRLIIPPIQLSTDEKQIAFQDLDNPTQGSPAIKIVDANGHARQILGSYPSTRYPVWIPPLPNAHSLKSAFAACNVSNKGWFDSLNAKIDAGQWEALITEVNAQTGKKIDETCAYDLISAATYLSGKSPAAATANP